jgi:Replication-relaxation
MISGGYVTAGRVRDLTRILSQRDLEILETVAQLRFVAGSQLQRMHVTSGTRLGNERVSRRVLQRLVSLEVLDRLERRVGGAATGSEGYVYVLAVGGQYLAHKREVLAKRRRRRATVPGQLFVHHALAVSELHARMVEADRAARFQLLERTAEPACWRPFLRADGAKLILKPDSYAQVSIEGERVRYLIDVDRGTEGSRTLDRRLRIYCQYHSSGYEQARHGVFPKVLWLARTDKRMQVIADVVSYLPPKTQPLFEVAHFDQAIDVMTRMG